MRGPRVNVTVAIIGWNGGDDIQACLESVLRQSSPVIQTLVVDNGSIDGSIEKLLALDPDLELIRNHSNVGFARAANEAFAAARGQWLLLLNQDVLLEPDYLLRLLMAAEANPSIGSVTGKLLRLGLTPNVIDSAGHVLFRNGWAVNRGELELDHGQFDREEEVFGVCAAAALYRMTMLHDICEGVARPFDERLVSYIEDVDVDWRARWLGWRAWYVPAVAWHRRSGSNVAAVARQARRTVANRLMVVANNDLWPSGLLRLPAALAFGFAGTLRSMRRSIDAPLGLIDALRAVPESRARRRFLVARRQVTPGEIASWMRPYPYRERLLGLLRKARFRHPGAVPQFVDPGA
jgi:GT2 family glycosyltransferase